MSALKADTLCVKLITSSYGRKSIAQIVKEIEKEPYDTAVE